MLLYNLLIRSAVLFLVKFYLDDSGVKIRPVNKVKGFELSVLLPHCVVTIVYKNGRLTENFSDLLKIFVMIPETIIFIYIFSYYT